MKTRVGALAGCGLLLVLVTPSPGLSATIRLEATIVTGLDLHSGSRYGGWGLANPTPGGTWKTVYPPGRDSATAIATGVFDENGLHLGVQTLVDFTSLWVDANAIATLYDTLTIGGRPVGSAGFLRAVFDYDGSVICNGGVGADCYASLFANGIFNLTQDSRSGTVALDVPFTFGVPTPLQLGLAARAVDRFSGTRFRANVDFLNSADLTLVQVLDANKAVVPDGTVWSEGGLAYPMASVPEPVSLLLVLIGVAGVAARGVRRRRG